LLTYISMRTFFALNLLPRTACMQNLQEQNVVKTFFGNLIWKITTSQIMDLFFVSVQTSGVMVP
jgi:hypothetical protein